MCQTRAGVCHVANPRRAWDVTHVTHVTGGGARIREKHARGGALLRCTCTRVRESLSHVSHAWKNKDLACHKACHMVCHACHMGGSCVAPGWIEGGLEGEVGVGEPLAHDTVIPWALRVALNLSGHPIITPLHEQLIL